MMCYYFNVIILSTGPVSLTVSEGATPGVVHTFQAIDNDGPSDGVLQYTISTPVSTHCLTLIMQYSCSQNNNPAITSHFPVAIWDVHHWSH